MSLFGMGRHQDRYGVVVDVGSGSVLVSIVHSNPAELRPALVWSYRESAPLRNIESLEQSAKVVMTALVNATMRLDTEGRKVLYEYNQKAVLTELQCGISAPWSYTVTKSINYHQDEPFRVTKDIVADLERTVQEKVLGDLSGSVTLKNLGLHIIDQATTNIMANGYIVDDPVGQDAHELTLSHTSALSQEHLLNVVSELREKLFPRVEVRFTSFVLIFFSVIRHFLEPARDILLVDVTDEATEIGVVRDSILTYATHTPFGHFSLAREIAAVTGLPLHEAHSHLYAERPYQFVDTLPKIQKEAVEKVFDVYTEKLAELFQETGDELSIPKRVYLHTEQRTEQLYGDLVDKAVRRCIKSKPAIRFVTSEIIKLAYDVESRLPHEVAALDSALVLSAQFFHMHGPKNQE